MNFKEQIERLERIKQMHRLISDKTTGTPETFAKKVGLSRRQMYNQLDFFKSYNAPIKYSKVSQTFYYEGNFEINFEFSLTITVERETQKVFHISSEDNLISINNKEAICVQ
jgi:transcriptional antiterminator